MNDQPGQRIRYDVICASRFRSDATRITVPNRSNSTIQRTAVRFHFQKKKASQAVRCFVTIQTIPVGLGMVASSFAFRCERAVFSDDFCVGNRGRRFESKKRTPVNFVQSHYPYEPVIVRQSYPIVCTATEILARLELIFCQYSADVRTEARHANQSLLSPQNRRRTPDWMTALGSVRGGRQNTEPKR